MLTIKSIIKSFKFPNHVFLQTMSRSNCFESFELVGPYFQKLRRLEVSNWAINATSYSLWRSATSAEPSMVFILTHLLTTFSKDILILTTTKPTYKLFAGLNAAFCQLYFQSFALKVPSSVQNHQFGSFYVVSEKVLWCIGYYYDTTSFN